MSQRPDLIDCGRGINSSHTPGRGPCIHQSPFLQTGETLILRGGIIRTFLQSGTNCDSGCRIQSNFPAHNLLSFITDALCVFSSIISNLIWFI